MTDDPLANINWRMLRVQKLQMHYVADGIIENVPDNTSAALGGLINWLDDIQDYAEENELAPDTDIFTHRELEFDREVAGLPGLETPDEMAEFVVIDAKHGLWLDAFITREKAGACIEKMRDYGILPDGAVIITGDEWRARKDPNRVER